MRNVMKLVPSAIVIAVLSFGAASAEPVTAKTAKKLLFPAKKTAFQAVPQDFLSASDIETIKLMATFDAPEHRLVYYAAIAVSPKDGLMSAASQAVKGHHSLEAADKAAISACNALRSGGAACVVVARVAPKNWQPRELLLSEPATVAFAKKYRRGKNPKAMAISPSTGEFAIAKGDAAQTVALIECNGSASVKGASDCEIVISD